jgi:hypothetical protein
MGVCSVSRNQASGSHHFAPPLASLKTLLGRRWRGRIRRCFAFSSPVQHLQIVFGCRFQIPGVQCLAGVVDVFDGEIEAAFALAEAAPVVGQAGNGGFLGAAAGFQGAHLGFEFRQEIAARAHWGEIGLVLFGKGELAIDVSAQRLDGWRLAALRACVLVPADRLLADQRQALQDAAHVGQRGDPQLGIA